MYNDLKLSLIIGPTGCGKTKAAKSLALSLDAPIVVADRIQCYTDIPVTSAREEDTNGLSYNYISDRTIADGDYLANKAFSDLKHQIKTLSADHGLIVIEGGSISLLTEFASYKKALPLQFSIEMIPIGSRRQHWARLRRRAMEMLKPVNEQPGLLQELSQAWRHVKQRQFIASINGFEAVLTWCQRHGVNPEKVGDELPSEQGIFQLATEIANAHMEHSLEQEAAMKKLFNRLKIHNIPEKSKSYKAYPNSESNPIRLKNHPTYENKNKPKVTVYCGARPGISPAYTEAAVQLGQSLATSGIELVYGGGSIGLMGTLADSVLASGGSVCGVIPKPMVDYELAHTCLTTMHVTETMHERKALMAELGDAFIALPGGIGTAEELLEVLTWNQLGIHSKPCILFNVNDFFTPFTALLDHFVATQFMSSSDAELVIVCTNSTSVVNALSQASPRIEPTEALSSGFDA
jgi:uncharacterized protein (TIGR00730 family)